MIIIGITGTLGAGKGTIVEYLVEKKGFIHYSVRAYLLEKIREQGLKEDRDNMFRLGNDLRARFGSSYIIDQLYNEAMKAGENCVIESLRTPGEIDSLRNKGHFYLLAIDADPIFDTKEFFSANQKLIRYPGKHFLKMRKEK